METIDEKGLAILKSIGFDKAQKNSVAGEEVRQGAVDLFNTNQLNDSCVYKSQEALDS